MARPSQTQQRVTYGIPCPKCSRKDHPIYTRRVKHDRGATLATETGTYHLKAGDELVDRCVRCRGHYPVSLPGVRL